MWDGKGSIEFDLILVRGRSWITHRAGFWTIYQFKSLVVSKNVISLEPYPSIQIATIAVAHIINKLTQFWERYDNFVEFFFLAKINIIFHCLCILFNIVNVIIRLRLPCSCFSSYCSSFLCIYIFSNIFSKSLPLALIDLGIQISQYWCDGINTMLFCCWMHIFFIAHSLLYT